MSEELCQDDDWRFNYFNYFTEVEEHFQKARGTGLFLLSPLDWALIEAWKNAGVPLEAVLRGIDAAFEKWRSRKSKVQAVNSLAYCAQAVAVEAQVLAGIPSSARKRESAPPFSVDEVRRHLEKNAAELRAAGHAAYADIAASLERLATEVEAHYADLEALEQRLTALEDKMIGAVKSNQTEELLFTVRREMDLQLRPYRGKMTTEQLAMLEKQYVDRILLEKANLPRLSLFYLR